jgi:hypothetical protein
MQTPSCRPATYQTQVEYNQSVNGLVLPNIILGEVFQSRLRHKTQQHSRAQTQDVKGPLNHGGCSPLRDTRGMQGCSHSVPGSGFGSFRATNKQVAYRMQHAPSGRAV